MTGILMTHTVSLTLTDKGSNSITYLFTAFCDSFALLSILTFSEQGKNAEG